MCGQLACSCACPADADDVPDRAATTRPTTMTTPDRLITPPCPGRTIDRRTRSRVKQKDVRGGGSHTRYALASMADTPNLDVKRTYLEMTAPADLRPARRADPDTRVERVEGS